MSALRFCFVLHLHQPVGNFDHVFREHAEDVYRPFLDFLEHRSLWPIGLHVSGPLLEWMGENDPSLHDRIGRFVDEGRIELLSAGWYEPILAALPRADRADQLGWMRDELERRFGVRAKGLWLTERVWESDLPIDLADSGIEYALVDDHLARRAGVDGTDLLGPLRTEAGGRTLDLLPIDERLRYLIPFRPAAEIEAELRERHARGDALALIGDDGEKFGGWPRTREWLYEGGWLEAFGDAMDHLRSEGIVRWITPSDVRDEVPARGPVYLPSGSYPEMEEWALGGHWKGFLARYPEANRMHRSMLALSALCRERGDPPKARRAIGRAQCNDPYWHGVFGGLYMKHLREGVRRELMSAQRLLREGDALACERLDADGDGSEEWWLHGPSVSAWVSREGWVKDLQWLEAGTDVLDVLTRYREAYHEEAVVRRQENESEAARDEGGPSNTTGEGASAAPSIHDIEAVATLDQLPPVDPDTRVLVRERVLPHGVGREAYGRGEFEAVWTASALRGEDPESTDAGDAFIWRFRALEGAAVEKVLRLDADGSVRYNWSWDPGVFPPGAWFAPEVSLGADVSVLCEPDVERWQYAVVTTSKCPDGFERIEQGVSITPLWPIEAGEASLLIVPAP